MTVQYSYNSDTGGMCDSTVQYSTVQYSTAIILTLGVCVIFCHHHFDHNR